MQYLPKHPRRHDIHKQQPKHHLCSISPWLISWQLPDLADSDSSDSSFRFARKLCTSSAVCVRPHVSSAGVVICFCGMF